MTPDRWEQVNELFHSALARAPDRRAAFLDQACDGDTELRKEVDSLIRSHEQSGSFIDSPALEVTTEELNEHRKELVQGQMLSHYKIVSPIGAGGMGEVYLAQDTRLGRKVALKFLPDDLAGDERGIARFEQEARAASALNHPNVCVIHEVGRTDDGRHFMAMEYIDGQTLRQRITEKPLKLGEALDVAQQIAAGLDAAHAVGIIHRDIKPENIMLRGDGYVKVLDFGLATFTENLSKPRDLSGSSTITTVQTEPGTRMGTVKYMSPEQLRELPLDERTDIWSLGVVLYEMVTGVTPFEAPSNSDIIALILEKQPPRLAFSSAEVPVQFQQVVQKALSKDRGERYHTVADLVSDLQRVRLQIEADRTQASARRYRASSAEYILSQIRAHRRAAIFAGVTTILAILVIIGLRHNPPAPRPVAPFQTIKISPLTNSGQSVCAAISPDGKTVAHAEERDGMQELQLTGVATGGTSVVIPGSNVRYLGVTFSADGNYLYFTRKEKSDAGVLYKLALPGSAPIRIKGGVDSPITFSPNGDRFSFVRFNRAGSEYSLITAEADGSGERTLATRRNGNTFSVYGPAWSPDGMTIVCGAGWWDNGYHMNLVEVGVGDGHVAPISEQQWFSVLGVAWLDDKSGLIINARERPLSPFQLWRIPYPVGESVRMTNDMAEYKTVSLSGDKIVAVRSERVWKIWVVTNGDVQRATQITSGVGSTYGLDWTGKGKIVFSSMAQDKLDISLINPDGSNKTQLTANAGDNYTPAASPDGRLIVFSSNRSGSFNIWRMNADDGSDPRQLTFSDGNSYPSSDNQWVFYDNQSGARVTVWKVPIEGGEPVQLTDEYARMPAVSPDMRFMACRYYVQAGLVGIAILPLQGESPIRLVPEIPIIDWQQVQWTADGRALTYIDIANGISNIWSYDLGTLTSSQLTYFQSEQIFAYAYSPDYRQLACQRGSQINDVTIITSQRLGAQQVPRR